MPGYTVVVVRDGLSPRVRGNRSNTNDAAAPAGFIPACAGEPGQHAGTSPPQWVYPRVCGGTYTGMVKPETGCGLSPRVRGNLSPTALSSWRCRSIPACAGEPCPYRKPAAARGVYPRVCGGTLSLRPGHLQKPGLSPRVRGNPSHPFTAPQGVRSIPACAGEPAPVPAACRCPGVYPRVCGGTLNGSASVWWNSGLSPRVRGNLPAMRAKTAPLRSIPACAGEPGWGAD